jgi:oxygen-independent coproporphyrinogen-3 oxidase
MKNLSVYIHIPFCVRKCLYCDFLSFPTDEGKAGNTVGICGSLNSSNPEKCSAGQDILSLESYVNLLLREIKEQSLFYKGHRVISVFLGGGTPSILKEGQIAALMEQIKFCYNLDESAEITIEMNPGTVTDGKLREYITHGINRVSIGLQSTDDGELQRIGRIHDYETFLHTYHMARDAGFANINVDLMSALPGQSEASYYRTLERVTALAPEHISAYSLILEEGTPLYENRESYVFPSEEEERQMYLMTRRYLEEQGYHRYEISNYAKEGYECRHNKVYWQRGDYVGFGLGAASMVADCRWSNPRDFGAYETYIDNMCYLSSETHACSIQSIADDTCEAPCTRNHDTCQPQFAGFEPQSLTVPEQMEEFMFLGLRMMCGVSAADFYQKFGKSLEEVYGEVLEKFCAQGLLAREKDRVRLTDAGIDVSNYVMAEFLF